MRVPFRFGLLITPMKTSQLMRKITIKYVLRSSNMRAVKKTDGETIRHRNQFDYVSALQNQIYTNKLLHIYALGNMVLIPNYIS